MAYYFPFGAAQSVEKESVSYAFSAITASSPAASFQKVPTASFATSVVTTPPAGTAGTSITYAECQTLETASGFVNLIPGSAGTTGGTGAQGIPYGDCPPGTIECPLLFESLSMALPGFPNGINASRPSGSRFSKICMQVPSQCTTPVCPSYLYTASIPALP